MFSISVVAGIGYMAWAYTGLGKMSLIKWLLKKWNQIAVNKDVKFDSQKLREELSKLDYEDIELLTRYTLLNPLEKTRSGPLSNKTENSLKKLVKKMTDRNIHKRADLTSLDSIALFGT